MISVIIIPGAPHHLQLDPSSCRIQMNFQGGYCEIVNCSTGTEFDSHESRRGSMGQGSSYVVEPVPSDLSTNLVYAKSSTQAA